MRKLFLLVAIASIGFSALGQSAQNSYLSGKQYFAEGKYAMAMAVLQPLTSSSADASLAPYASFFYALSAYQSGEITKGQDMLMQVAQRYPNWEKMEEVKLWRAKMHLDQREFFSALDLTLDIKETPVRKRAEELKASAFAKENSPEMLKRIFDRYNTDTTVAKAYARALANSEVPQGEEMLDFLAQEFDLEIFSLKKQITFNLPLIEKDTFQVAVFLPFMLNDLNFSASKKSNQFVLDLYQGIKLAVEELNAKGMPVRLYAYDTQKNALTTRNILSLPEIKGMDLIIGPLYPGPSKLVFEFAYENAINIINPLSTNSSLVKDNPYSFLAKPTAEDMGKAAGLFARKYFPKKAVMIFYGANERDSLMAAAYKQVLAADSFPIVMERKVSSKNSRDILNILTHSQFRKELNEQGDTIIVRNDADGKVRVDEMTILTIPHDSIGHIFVAAGEQLIASNTISGIDTRGDAIPLLTLEDWLDYETMSFEQLERLNVHFIAPEFIEYATESMEGFKDVFLEKTATLPSSNAILGYDIMHFAGYMLHTYGKFFQTGFNQEGFHKANFLQGFDYTNSQSNTVIPIIHFEDAELIKVN
ncbi:ABC transporter substrate-binding protein [Cytophagales bacterium LB-30]|uniref:ABC transporter substrate-binding protein n=1 Tax=Shiella aurantiaca TaxID=3058365 RepID=A0ABT8F3N1_9BACT|nr:ABC transporter substrate-binding protein [Shiella aurantiaca]MDN4164831.1 ABC transporter substrate-binding protein [Shiella aurantiaca]